MSRRSCRDPANALLPWYLNGSLEGEEEAQVRSHLDACAECREQLDQLADVAALVRRHGVPVRTKKKAPVLAAGLAAMLLLAVALVAYGVGASRALRRAAPEPSLQGAARIDLGAGAMRGTADIPSVTLSPDISWVVLSFLVTMRPDARYHVALEEATGRVVANRDGLGSLDAVGASVFAVPRSALLGPGDYALVLTERVPGTAPRVYRFPFKVNMRPSPKR